MGQPDDDSRDEQARVDARLLRTEDLINLRLEALDCTLEPTEAGSELVAGPDASLVLTFPPQHLGEEAWPVHPDPPEKPTFPSRHIAAGPSRLVYAVPEGTRIPFTLAQLLEALHGLHLRVSPNATPAGQAGDGGLRPPAELETAIEAPYHLIVSPSERGTFRHPSLPQGPPGSAEIWRTHLSVRPDAGTTDNAEQHIVRALWNRDEDAPPPGFRQPLSREDRDALVAQTNGGEPANARTPLQVSHLSLSSLGAWFDWKQSWEFPATIVDYRHQAYMGRDGYVRVVYPGFLFPFGHRCVLVEVTEREVKHRDNPVAYLWTRWFIMVRQPTRSYPEADRDNPFGLVTISPLVTPDLDPPSGDQEPFIPTRGGVPFAFTLNTADRGGMVSSWAAPLVFVRAGMDEGQVFLTNPEKASSTYFQVRRIQGRGQGLAAAKPVKAGDTSVEVVHLIFDGEIDVDNVTSRPFLTEARAILPSMRHLAPQAPAVDVEFAKPYLDHGLPPRELDGKPVPGTPNAGELILRLKDKPAAIDFSSGSDRSGGFVAPNVLVKGISRAFGAVGESGDVPSAFDSGTFDPKSFLSGAAPKLFGLFSLLDLLKTAGFDETPAFVSDAIDAVTKLLTEAQRLRKALDGAQARLADEVAQAAHSGAQAVAEHAKEQLEARAGSLKNDLDELIGAVAGLLETPGADNAVAVREGASAVAAHLQTFLTDVNVPGIPVAVRTALEKPARTLETLTGMARDAEGLAQLLQGLAGGQITTRLHWEPAIQAWRTPGSSGVPNVFKPKNEQHALRIDVEVRSSASGPPGVDIAAEIVDFDLNLIGDGPTGLMKLMFRRLGFHAGSDGKTEVDIVFGGISFLGPLSFMDRLRELIPFDGFSDPPYVDVAPAGVTAGFDLTLPNVAIGVFSLENISLGADARVPFLGDALTVGFYFCTKDAPFRLTVMAIGGGGWLALRASPKGLVLLELGLEAAASLSVDLGVASGSVSIAVGVYLRLEADNGMLAAYFRIRGEVEVLGLVSASITLELSLTYHYETGKLIGRASLVVEVEVLFFSASVEITVERKLAGSKGDPTMYQIMPPDEDGMNADWARYCDAFAPA
ncbi:hypothetical protein QNO08_07340 [Arthrobacter sp. zg-Y820]|uniref:hypothetical protein n=1 Tax=unclassified Arthrobacter TaxID=235627 RepID=UPI001E352E7C|nr:MULTISPECIES: hypothetical protein [unclassified Arthrobacter]MCC9197668.1 hypothetical protein [Arthrobacter sp. zg-Y820]MDK1280535.1 hypothetical protein [Arthrobacter sp. zg.Y820]WIB10826.1 hypothetical protein QNO08_07340 [Arthrobacter sp. zg-Y820]